jgi:PilZ domain
LNRHTNRSSSEWDKWTHLLPNWNQRDRHPLIQMVRIERSTLRVVEDEQQIPQIMGLTVNVSNGGLCLLVDWFPNPGEIVRVHLPLSTVGATTPTLADVQWARPLPFQGCGLAMVGLKFLV